MIPRLRELLCAAGACLLPACPARAPTPSSAEAPARARGAWSDDPRAAAARDALDRGRLALAQNLIEQLGEPGVEGALLRARLAALAEDDVAAGRFIEDARRADPGDPRVYATAAELHAAAGRSKTADAEIQRGLEACGPGPELLRARGVYLITQRGGASAGLELLRSAHEADPDLPFLGRALGQAHLLVGKQFMGGGDVAAALEHARLSLEFDPGDQDARRFHAEASLAAGDFATAIGVYETLLEEGEPLSGELASVYKNAGMAALLQKERALAIRFFRRARELGLGDEVLGTGARVLEAEAAERVDRSVAALTEGELERAEALAREALELAPGYLPAREELAHQSVVRALKALEARELEDAEQLLGQALEWDRESLEAHNFLALVQFEREDFAGAVREWSWVVDTAQMEGLVLPEPVHLNLTQAQVRDGDLAGARATLEGYLLLEPTGAFVEETRRVLAALPE